MMEQMWSRCGADVEQNEGESLHPSCPLFDIFLHRWADTPGVATSLPGFRERMEDSLRTPEQGADTIIWCAASPQVSPELSGSFFEDRRPVDAHLTASFTSFSCTPERRKALYDICLSYAHISPEQSSASSSQSSSSSSSSSGKMVSEGNRFIHNEDL